MRNLIAFVAIIAVSIISFSFITDSTHTEGGIITMKLKYSSGSPADGVCDITNSYEGHHAFDESVCTNDDGVAKINVRTSDKVLIKIQGHKAACASAGESITVTVETEGLTGTKPKYPYEGDCD